MARSACCRSGRSRQPPVSRPSEWSSRRKIACGGSSLIRAAASSMASGRPSSLRAIAAIAAAFSSSSSKSGTAAAARSANRRTDSQAASEAAAGRASSAGTASGGTGHSCSPETRSGERLLTRIRTALVSSSSRVTTGAPSSRCSKLSSTIRSCRSRNWLTRCSISGRSRASCNPMLWAIVDGTSPGSRTGASGTK